MTTALPSGEIPSDSALRGRQTYRLLRDPVFTIACAAYLANRIATTIGWLSLRGWFNDLLLVPCALPLLTCLWERLGLRSRGTPPTPAEVFWVLALWSIGFEALGPLWIARSTADPLDVVAYSTGGLLALAVWRSWPARIG